MRPRRHYWANKMTKVEKQKQVQASNEERVQAVNAKEKRLKTKVLIYSYDGRDVSWLRPVLRDGIKSISVE